MASPWGTQAIASSFAMIVAVTIGVAVALRSLQGITAGLGGRYPRYALIALSLVLAMLVASPIFDLASILTAIVDIALAQGSSAMTPVAIETGWGVGSVAAQLGMRSILLLLSYVYAFVSAFSISASQVIPGGNTHSKASWKVLVLAFASGSLLFHGADIVVWAVLQLPVTTIMPDLPSGFGFLLGWGASMLVLSAILLAVDVWVSKAGALPRAGPHSNEGVP